MVEWRIYADGFCEYKFTDEEAAIAKLKELVAEEQDYQYKRNWYMKEVLMCELENH